MMSEVLTPDMPERYVRLKIQHPQEQPQSFAFSGDISNPPRPVIETIEWLRSQPEITPLDIDTITPDGHILVEISSEDPSQNYRFSFPEDSANQIDIIAAQIRLGQNNEDNLVAFLDQKEKNECKAIVLIKPQLPVVYQPPVVRTDTTLYDKWWQEYQDAFTMLGLVTAQILADMKEFKREETTTAENVALKYWQFQLDLYEALLYPEYDEDEVIDAEFEVLK